MLILAGPAAVAILAPMRNNRFLAAIALVAGFLVTGSPAHAGVLDAAFFPGKVTSFYGPAGDNTEDNVLMNGLREGRLAENLAAATQQSLLLKHNLAVGIAKCGALNAFYNPRNQSVTICLELIKFIMTTADEQGLLQKPESKKFMAGVVFAVYAHELGHALIHLDNIAVTGREEDVADQFAVYFGLRFLEPAGINPIGPAVWFYRALAQRTGGVGTLSAEQVRHLMSNEHSLDEQRVFNVVCWAHGANPTKAARLVQVVQLDPQRKERCAGEYARMNHGIQSQFGRFIRSH